MDLDKLEAAARAATQSEWSWEGRKVDPEDGYVYIPECSYIVGGISLAFQHEGYQADCDFIAAANPAAVLELIALARKGIAAEAPDAEAVPVAWLYDDGTGADEPLVRFKRMPSLLRGWKETPLFAAPAPEAAPVAPDATCTCPSGDGSLRWPCPKHPPVAPDELPPLPEPDGVLGHVGDGYGQEDWVEANCPAWSRYSVEQYARAALSSQHQTNQGESQHG